MEFEYHEKPEIYEDAFEASGHRDVLEEYKSWDIVENDYEDPVEYLEERESKAAADQVVELAEVQNILNSDSGSIAGMQEIHSD